MGVEILKEETAVSGTYTGVSCLSLVLKVFEDCVETALCAKYNTGWAEKLKVMSLTDVLPKISFPCQLFDLGNGCSLTIRHKGRQQVLYRF